VSLASLGGFWWGLVGFGGVLVGFGGFQLIFGTLVHFCWVFVGFGGSGRFVWVLVVCEFHKTIKNISKNAHDGLQVPHIEYL